MSANLTTLGVNTGEANAITYESAVDANGNVVAVDGFAPQGPRVAGSPPDYLPDVAHKYGIPTTGTSGGTVTFNFNGPWTAPQEAQIADSLALWSDIANIQFQFVASTNSSDPRQTYVDDINPPSTNDGTFTQDFEVSGSYVGTSTIAQVAGGGTNVQTSVPGWTDVGSFTQDGGYGITTMVHEDGHVLGLAHTGDYNAPGNTAATFSQLSAYDSNQWSIMSYFSPSDTTAAYYNQSDVTNTDWNGGTPQTWMPLDILAVQRLYGVQTSGPLTGGQTFGFNCNVGGGSEDYFDFTKNATPIITLWDAGTGNTLDLSGWSTGAAVDLRAGHFSSADGLTNNIGIGFGVHIDNVIGTTGVNTFILNADSDYVLGSEHGDTVTFTDAGGHWRESQLASNTFDWVGASATDQLVNTSYIAFTGGDDTISATATSDDLRVLGGNNIIFLSSGEATLMSGGGNTIVETAGSSSIFGTSSVSGPGDVIFAQQGAALSYVGGGAVDTIVANSAGLSGGLTGLLAFEQGSGARIDLASSAGASTVVGNSTGSITVTGGNNGVDVGGGAGSNLIELNGQSGVTFGGGNNDSIYSDTGGGTSYLIGDAGSELLDARGGSGEQVIYAGSGNDTLAGGTGTNVFVVGTGNATVVGDQGANLFEVQAGHDGGTLTIDAFDTNADYFGVYGYGANAAQIAYDTARLDGVGNTLVTLGDNTRIILIGVTSLNDSGHFFGG